MNVKKTILVALFMISFSQFSKAQVATDSIKTNQLQEVIVIGTRTERNVATLPLPTQIISGESIKNSGLSRLNEIIQEQTGLTTTTNFGGGEGLQIQGLNDAYVLILLDGHPLIGRSAGTLDLSRITLNNIERIEIVKGASSSLYGSEALGGVINIITKKPLIPENVKGNINYKIATFRTQDVSTSLEFGQKKIGVELFGNFLKTEGYNLSDNDYLQTIEPFFNFTFHPKVKINYSDKIKIFLNSRIYAQNQDNKAKIANEKYIGKSNTDEWNNSIVVNQKVSNKLKLVYDLYATNYKAYEYLNSQENKQFEESKYNQAFYRLEVRSNYQFGKNTLSTGIGINDESLDRTNFAKLARLNSEYVFGQFEWFIQEKWNVLAGFRYDHHHQYQSQFSPKIAVNYKLNDNFSLKTSLGYGYKAPDLRQLYFDFTNSSVGYTVLGYQVAQEKLALLQSQGQILFTNSFTFSKPLLPESSLNVNFGGYYKKTNWTFDYNLFYNVIKNLIDTRAIAQKTNGQNVFSYFNLNKIFTYGLEFNTAYQFNSNLSISAGYQYLIAKDQTMVEKIERGEIFARDPISMSTFKLKPGHYFGLYNRSKHTANFKINYLIPYINTSVNARVFYKSDYGINDTNNNSILDQFDEFVKGYFLTNIALNKDFTNQFAFQMGVNNLLDYTDKKNISNLPGRQFYTRVQFQF
jgi:outer membrane receptor for ferrienterochelin and colicins